MKQNLVPYSFVKTKQKTEWGALNLLFFHASAILVESDIIWSATQQSSCARKKNEFNLYKKIMLSVVKALKKRTMTSQFESKANTLLCRFCKSRPEISRANPKKRKTFFSHLSLTEDDIYIFRVIKNKLSTSCVVVMINVLIKLLHQNRSSNHWHSYARTPVNSHH